MVENTTRKAITEELCSLRTAVKVVLMTKMTKMTNIIRKFWKDLFRNTVL